MMRQMGKGPDYKSRSREGCRQSQKVSFHNADPPVGQLTYIKLLRKV